MTPRDGQTSAPNSCEDSSYQQSLLRGQQMDLKSPDDLEQEDAQDFLPKLEEEGLLRNSSRDPSSKEIDLSGAPARLNMRRRPRAAWYSRQKWSNILVVVFSGVLCFILVSAVLIRSQPLRGEVASQDQHDPYQLFHHQETYQKPSDQKIYAVVFFGRQTVTEILDCYLRRNLVRNGGWLDGVHFLVHTDDEEDRQWINKTTAEVPEYEAMWFEAKMPFYDMWREALIPGAITIKVDDDLVWLADQTIPEIVTSLVKRPDAFCVLGNLINSAALGWLHHGNGAHHTFLPEQKSPDFIDLDAYSPQAWRASSLPTYTFSDEVTSFPNEAQSEPAPVPYPNHRWLPLRDNDLRMDLTPLRLLDYDPFSFQWTHWSLPAQAHYSFLQNLEEQDLSAYRFGNANGFWDLHGMRGNINLMAVRSDDILDNTVNMPKAPDDEEFFTITLPKDLSRPVLVQSKAMAAHFSFVTQRTLYETDLLPRYRAYANEFICREENKITPKEVWPTTSSKDDTA